MASASARPQTILRAVPLGALPISNQRVVPVAQPLVQPVAAPVVAPVRTVVQTEEIAEIDPSYHFGYSVTDAKTGDSKTREEVRDGNVVRGSYTVADPDGRLRTVTYTADEANGFNAVVTYDGEAGPPAIPIDVPAQVVQSR